MSDEHDAPDVEEAIAWLEANPPAIDTEYDAEPLGDADDVIAWLNGDQVVKLSASDAPRKLRRMDTEEGAWIHRANGEIEHIPSDAANLSQDTCTCGGACDDCKDHTGGCREVDGGLVCSPVAALEEIRNRWRAKTISLGDGRKRHLDEEEVELNAQSEFEALKGRLDV